MMAPINNLTKHTLGVYDVMDDEAKLLNFLRMEKWLADRPDHAGAAARQWLVDLYQKNLLIKGVFELGGEVVDLNKVTMPVLNVYRQDDHIVPPKSTAAARRQGGHQGLHVDCLCRGGTSASS